MSERDYILEALPVGILILSSSGDVVAHNDRALGMLGIRVEDLLQGTAMDAVPDESVRGAIDQVLCTTGSRTQIALRRADRTYAVSVSAGEKGGAVVAVTDTTDFKQMDRLKEQFVETILHKLRGPLATVKTSLSVLKSNRIPDIPDEAKEIVSMSHHEVNRLALLLDDLRCLFRIDLGLAGRDMDIEVFPLAEGVKGAVRDLTRLSGPYSGARSRVKVDGDTSLCIKADFSMTKHVFFALLANALVFSGESDPVRVTIEAASDMVAARVADQGPGIADGDLPFVFSKFFRGFLAESQHTDGNGLGLFIAKSFAEIMGGTLYCESGGGKGAVLRLTLPGGEGQ